MFLKLFNYLPKLKKFWIVLAFLKLLFLIFLLSVPDFTVGYMFLFIWIWVVLFIPLFLLETKLIKHLINEELKAEKEILRKLLLKSRNLLIIITFLDLCPFLEVITFIFKLFFLKNSTKMRENLKELEVLDNNERR